MTRSIELVCENCGEEFAAVYSEELCETCEQAEQAADVHYGESVFDRLDDCATYYEPEPGDFDPDYW